MLLSIGFIIVIASVLLGFMQAGGNPAALMHLSEFIVVGGMSFGMLVVASSAQVVKDIIHDISAAFKGGGLKKEEFLDLMMLLYELFMVGRRNGLIALDEHVTDPNASSIMSKYPSFLAHKDHVSFLCNALRPIIDGKIKPEQLEELLDTEITTKQEQAHLPVQVLQLVGDSLPGIGICAAVLGVINTMGSVDQGTVIVGQKVAAALTGTFLGVYGAYGFVNPLTLRVQTLHKGHFLYYTTMAQAVSGFAKGLAPLMAIEIARRSLVKEVQPASDELEEILKGIGKRR